MVSLRQHNQLNFDVLLVYICIAPILEEKRQKKRLSEENLLKVKSIQNLVNFDFSMCVMLVRNKNTRIHLRFYKKKNNRDFVFVLRILFLHLKISFLFPLD